MNSAASINSLVEHHDALPAPEGIYTLAIKDMNDSRNEEIIMRVQAGVEPMAANPDDYMLLGDIPYRRDAVAFIQRELGDDPSQEDIDNLSEGLDAAMRSDELDVKLTALELRNTLSGMSSSRNKISKDQATGINVDGGYGNRHGRSGGLITPKSVYNPN